MLVGDKVSHSAVYEAYCLLCAYVREDGKLVADYDKEPLTEFTKFLAEILKHPENFPELCDRKTSIVGSLDEKKGEVNE